MQNLKQFIMAFLVGLIVFGAMAVFIIKYLIEVVL